MKLITRQTRANEAAEAWARQYPYGDCPDRRATIAELEALGENPSPDDVDAVVGSDAWTRIQECDECGAPRPEKLVCFPFGIHRLNLCRACLARAMALIDGVEV